MNRTQPQDPARYAITGSNCRRVGIYGGSFDPVHSGHLQAARDARDALQLDEVIFVPTGIPPHKAAGHCADPLHRYHMARLAVSGEPGFRVSDIEVRSDAPSYSVDTVRTLVAGRPEVANWYFILGDDCAANLHRWQGLDELLHLVHFISINRQGRVPAPQVRHAVTTLQRPPDPTSSSEIRRALGRGDGHALPIAPQVLSYIRRHALYGYPPNIDRCHCE